MTPPVSSKRLREVSVWCTYDIEGRRYLLGDIDRNRRRQFRVVAARNAVAVHERGVCPFRQRRLCTIKEAGRAKPA